MPARIVIGRFYHLSVHGFSLPRPRRQRIIDRYIGAGLNA
jgi:hypothetical protein